MAPNKTRKEIKAEIEELHRLHIESTRQATFGGWTREAEIEHDRRVDRIGAFSSAGFQKGNSNSPAPRGRPSRSSPSRIKVAENRRLHSLTKAPEEGL